MAEDLSAWCGELGIFRPGFQFGSIRIESRALFVGIVILVKKGLLVIGATGVHPGTSRTRSLSPSAPMVLGGRPPGRVGHRQETFFIVRCKVYKHPPPSPRPRRPPTGW